MFLQAQSSDNVDVSVLLGSGPTKQHLVLRGDDQHTRCTNSGALRLSQRFWLHQCGRLDCCTGSISPMPNLQLCDKVPLRHGEHSFSGFYCIAFRFGRWAPIQVDWPAVWQACSGGRTSWGKKHGQMLINTPSDVGLNFFHSPACPCTHASSQLHSKLARADYFTGCAPGLATAQTARLPKSS